MITLASLKLNKSASLGDPASLTDCIDITFPKRGKTWVHSNFNFGSPLVGIYNIHKQK